MYVLCLCVYIFVTLLNIVYVSVCTTYDSSYPSLRTQRALLRLCSCILRQQLKTS